MAAAVAVTVPLAMDPAGYFIFLPLKWALSTALVALGLAVLVLQRRPVARNVVVGAWAVLLGAVVLASIAGTGGLTSWIGYPDRYLGVLAWATFFGAFVLGCSTTGDRDRALVVRAAAAASILVSLYALLQEIDVDPIEWEANIDVSRTRSTFGNAAFLGAYLAMIVPLAGRLALAATEPRRVRALFAAAAALGAVALLTTETRGAWLGASAGIAVIVALDHRRWRALPRRRLGAIAAGVLVGLAVLATMSPYASRIRSVTDLGQATGRGRLIQWERTLELVGERPVLGWGPDTYAFTFPRFVDARFEREVKRDVIPDRAHNVFLDMTATTGLVGVAALLAVLVLVGRGAVRARERDPLTVGLAGACAAYVGQLQFSFSLVDLDVVFWLLAGLLTAAAVPRGRAIRRPWALVPLAATVLVAVWGGMELAADRTLRQALEAEADGDFETAQRLVDRAVDRAPLRAQYLQGAGRLHARIGELSARPQDFARALDAIDGARDLVPRDLELAMDRGDILLSWGESARDRELIERAVRQYEEILRRDPFSSRVHLKLGVAYVEVDRPRHAEEEWRLAASLSPRSPGPLLNLGRLYQRQGRDEDARAVLRSALALDPGNAPARQLLEGLEP